jgi:hypothetical protein
MNIDLVTFLLKFFTHDSVWLSQVFKFLVALPEPVNTDDRFEDKLTGGRRGTINN